jgi:four helix bundle protein
MPNKDVKAEFKKRIYRLMLDYFHIALKSTNETIFWVCLLRDSKKSSSKDSNLILEELRSIAKIFAFSLLTIKGRKSV